MKRLFLPMLCLLSGCKNDQQRNLEHADSLIAESKKQLQYYKISTMADSIMKADTKTIMFDTVGVGSGPVVVTSSAFVEKQYSNFKDMHLKYKNVSGKKIDAIRFRWYGENAFGEPADMGTSPERGFGGGFTDSPLLPGKTGSGTWGILSRDGKRIIAAWAYEVVFSDGSKWKSSSPGLRP